MLYILMEFILSLEITFSLHDERMKNIEAKKRSEENYLILLNKHMQDKQRISGEIKKSDEELSAQTTLFKDNKQSCENSKKQ